MVKENFLHFIWKFGLFDKEHFSTVTGEKVEVLLLGTHNTDAGPDFINAKLTIGDVTWAGNVELHLNTSDWAKHGHSANAAYNNVILHVVKNNDVAIQHANERNIPVAVLCYNEEMEQRYYELMQAQERTACRPFMRDVEPFQLQHFLSRVLVDRLEVKSQRLTDILAQTVNDWQEAFHRLLFRSFGFNVNTTAFELLAQQTPYLAIAKHHNSLSQLEAMLFGQAGFLEEPSPDEYHAALKSEYEFLRNKLKLKPIDKHLWKFLRLRPSNFPTIRIAQLAYLLHTSNGLLDTLLSCKASADYFKLFDIRTSDYWETHYTFGSTSAKKAKPLGKASAERVITNAVVPYLFTYGKERKNEAMQEKAFSLLEALPPERNAVIDHWADCGIKVDNAFFSQALLQLKTDYCDKKRCLHCIVGRQMIIPKKGTEYFNLTNCIIK